MHLDLRHGHFKYVKVVVLVVFNRFEYFSRVLKSLESADGSHEYTVIAAVDGTQPSDDTSKVEGRENILNALYDLKKANVFSDVVVSASNSSLGVWKNKKRGVSLGFELSDFVIVLEDDITISPDGLRWFEWHVTSGLIFKHKELATASCWSSSFTLARGTSTESSDRLFSEELQLQDRWIRSSWVHPWGWAMWRRTWDEFGENWTGQDQNLARAIQARGFFETHPMLARCDNIGSVGVNKRGKFSGHVHARSLTSASKAISIPADYGLCPPVAVYGQTLQNMNPPELYNWLRGGIGDNLVVESVGQDEIKSRVSHVRQSSTAWSRINCEEY